MNTLRLNIINLHAPYRVWQKSGKPEHYYFVSDSGVEFNIDFKLDYAFVPSGAFEFSITNERHGQSPLDMKLKLLLMLVFFYARKQWKTYTKRDLWMIFLVDVVIAALYNYDNYFEPTEIYTDYLLIEIWIRPTITYGMVACFVTEVEE